MGNRRSLHWERGLKLVRRYLEYRRDGRSLHWERGLKRGLKRSASVGGSSGAGSLPSLGAWIETVLL